MARELRKIEHVKLAVKHADKKGRTPLHYAVKKGNKVLTELLFKQNINIAYMQDNDGMTALHVAAGGGSWQIMVTIIKRYPDCSEVVDNKGWNFLHHAVFRGKLSIVIRIMRNLSLAHLFNEKDVDGNTPLHFQSCFIFFFPVINKLRVKAIAAKLVYDKSEGFKYNVDTGIKVSTFNINSS